MRLVLLLSVIFSFVFLLLGCATVATSGASALYNHKSLEKDVNDQYITLRSYQAIGVESKDFKNTNINIATFNHLVLLSGQAPTEEQKEAAEQIVKDIQGVERIYNWITVEKSSTHFARMKDAWLTAKIKAKLMVSDIDSTQVKVVTENRRVFLMGIVRPSEAQVAVKAASTTPGVEEVVKLFYYLNLSKTPIESEST